MSDFKKFDKEYFLSLKTQKEKEDYFLNFIKTSLDKIEKGGNIDGNRL